MIEIWTEDSTAGYRFLKEINKVIYGNQLKIIPHNGIGEKIPSSTSKYGGILYHLKNHKTNNLVLLYIDKAIDIQATAENYEKVLTEAKKHTNIMIIEQVCFELGILSYNKLFDISGNTDKNLEMIAQEFTSLSRDLSKFRPPYFSSLLKTYIRNKCGKRQQYEHISKTLLSEITNVVTLYNGKHNTLALISGSKIGGCWMKDCCVIPPEYLCAKKCKISGMTEYEKIADIIKFSLISDVVTQINAYIDSYIKNTYKDAPAEMRYKSMYYARFGKLNLKHVGKIMEIYNYWNFERLYSNF